MITKKYYKLIRVSYADEGYFCLTNVSNSIGNVKLDNVNDSSGTVNYEYSTDGVTWNAYSARAYVQVAPNSNIYWRYAGSGYTISTYSFQFYFDFDCYASGNLMSLFSTTDFASYTGTWKASHLFFMQTHLLRADFNLGSQTSVGNHSFDGMFYGCTSLTTVPDLSGITSVEQSGMREMFRGCSALTTQPDLSNITSVGEHGMYRMFQYCTSLSTAYAPTITWDTLKTQMWLDSVAASGTLYADASIASTIPTNSADGCPNGWTVANI